MPSVLRYSAVAALVASVVSAGKWRGSAVALQTDHVGGSGWPIFEAMATQAPSLELVKRKLEVRAETNTCSEWTILGGNGVPVCSSSQTCIFSTVGNLRYEGCGLPNRGYDWVTECWNYPQTQTGTAGLSQVFCDAALPTCGVFEFVFADGITYSNFGCAATGYTYTAVLTDTSRSFDIALEPSTTPSPTPAKTGTVYVLPSTTNKTGGNDGEGKGSKAPVGAIVGGVIGGVAVIALLGFVAWYCLRKRKDDKNAQEINRQQQADAATAAAFHSSAQTAQMNEMEGSSIKPGVGAFAPPLPGNHFAPTPDKNMAMGGVDRPGLYPNQHSSGYSPSAGSPPPIYPPNGQVSSPSSNYTELDSTRQSAVPPLTPGTNMSELGAEDSRMSYQGGQSPPPPAVLPELGGSTATGGINRPAVGRQRQSGVDMSGAPMSSDYRPHELP